MTLTQRASSKQERTADELARLVASADPRISCGHIAAALHESHERIRQALVDASVLGYGYDPTIILPPEIAHNGACWEWLGKCAECNPTVPCRRCGKLARDHKVELGEARE